MMEKRIIFSPAYDKRGEKPNYGCSSMRIDFILMKEGVGAVEFELRTGWYLKSAQDAGAANYKHSGSQPEVRSIGYHSYLPRYDGHAPIGGACSILNGTCYHDGSSIRDEDWLENFLAKGDEWVWEMLEKEHKSVFGTTS